MEHHIEECQLKEDENQNLKVNSTQKSKECKLQDENQNLNVNRTKTKEMVGWRSKRQVMQGSEILIHSYVELSIIEDIKNELRQVGQDEYKEFENSCFGRLFSFDSSGYSCNKILHAIMTYEVIKSDALPDERWFRVGDRFVRFSKTEFALVMGMKFGDSSFDPSSEHVPPSSSLYMRCGFNAGPRLVLMALRERFLNGEFSGSGGDAVKIAKILFLYYILLGKDAAKTSIDKWVWALVEDANAWDYFPWGKLSFSFLLHHMDAFPCSLTNNSHHFYGCSFALMMCLCESIPNLGTKLGHDVVFDLHLQRPRCNRWRFNKQRIDISMANFFTNQVDCVLTLMPTIRELRESYWEDIDMDINTELNIDEVE